MPLVVGVRSPLEGVLQDEAVLRSPLEGVLLDALLLEELRLEA
jgi:hypothetical protein